MMPTWLRKVLVVTITIFTFGLVTPLSLLSLQESNSNNTSNAKIIDSHNDHVDVNSELNFNDNEEYTNQVFVKETIEQAENLAFKKFGSKIGPAIENEFREVILPKIEEVITELSYHYQNEELVNLAITEHPAGGIGERIFNIIDKSSGKDLLRFHVRRDKLPLEGYWFNFHYHSYKDSYATHHEIGNIYWDKNTPPKWLS